MKRLFPVSIALCVLAVPSLAAAQLTSAEVIISAQTYAQHPWHCSPANFTASCAPGYRSEFSEGDHMGLPYDWGGYMSLHTFDTGIASGLGAGSRSSDGELACTVGLDCSGFVSMVWQEAHLSTRSIPDLTRVITIPELKRGDVMNMYDYHVALFSHLQADGRPFFYEAAGYNVHQTFNQGWAYFNGYTPRRYLPDTDNPNTGTTGTAGNPLVIGAFPFTHSGNTSTSNSSMFDYCALAPTTRETGPEVVYSITLTRPGRLTASVQDVVGVDIDLHIYNGLNEGSCIARHDSTLDVRLDCGTYTLVADTYANATTTFAGAYDLIVDFAPETGSTCGANTGYEFLGDIGAPCGFPGNPNLSFCNENLGTTTCLYSATDSFCSVECAASSDCVGDFPGGCCEDLGQGEFYCLPAAYCTPVTPEATDVSPADTSAPDTSVTPDATLVPADTSTSADTSVTTDTSVATDTAVAPDATVSDTNAADTTAIPSDTSTVADTLGADSGEEALAPLTAGEEGCGCTIADSSRGSAAGFALFFAVVLGLARRRSCHRP